MVQNRHDSRKQIANFSCYPQLEIVVWSRYIQQMSTQEQRKGRRMVTIYLPEDVLDVLKSLAKQNERSLSGEARYALAWWAQNRNDYALAWPQSRKEESK